MQGLDFDDVLLTPSQSKVNSREDVDISVHLGGDLVLDIPIIGSPMKGIMGINLIKELSRLGGIGILHRFYDDGREWEGNLIELGLEKQFGVAIGIDKIEIAKIALSAGAKIICIDVANGYLESVIKFVDEISCYIVNNDYKCIVMAGNVVTHDGLWWLYQAGATLIRVGIGSGNLCTTRNVTGVGMPQLTAINDCASINVNKKDGRYRNTNPRIVADGGIRNSGDAVKAFAFGADVVMLGSLLATTYESSNNGIIYGMASRKLQDEYYHSVKSVEGIEQQVTPKQTLAEFIDEFTWGIKSACTYLDAPTLFRLKGTPYNLVGTSSIKKIGT